MLRAGRPEQEATAMAAQCAGVPFWQRQRAYAMRAREPSGKRAYAMVRAGAVEALMGVLWVTAGFNSCTAPPTSLRSILLHRW